jgi:hypothetical protein
LIPWRCANTPGSDHLLHQAMTNYRPLPPLERLHELLEVVEIPPNKYGIWSGLVRKVGRQGGGKAGSVAGSPHPSPSRPDRFDWTVTVDGVSYVASRVIYYMVHGTDPGGAQVDHKDQNWLNNNAWNLRLDVDGRIQMVNTPKPRDNTSGVVGVSWCTARRKWQTAVLIRGKRKHLGYYTCKIEAARVVRDKWIELGWDKLGRKLPDLNKIDCKCFACSSMTICPSDPAE